jgi:hypothetical protein
LLRSLGADVAKIRLSQALPHAANKLLDHIDGRQKAYADDVATIQVRKPDAVHTIEPTVDPKADAPRAPTSS